MQNPLHHSNESASNQARDVVSTHEPRSLRTYTPTQAVLTRSAGVYHWTPEGRRLYDFTSGVLVSNLGHNPSAWMKRYVDYMGWSGQPWTGKEPYFPALPMTAYNAVTALETEAVKRLVTLLQARLGGK